MIATRYSQPLSGRIRTIEHDAPIDIAADVQRMRWLTAEAGRYALDEPTDESRAFALAIAGFRHSRHAHA